MLSRKLQNLSIWEIGTLAKRRTAEPDGLLHSLETQVKNSNRKPRPNLRPCKFTRRRLRFGYRRFVFTSRTKSLCATLNDVQKRNARNELANLHTTRTPRLSRAIVNHHRGTHRSNHQSFRKMNTQPNDGGTALPKTISCEGKSITDGGASIRDCFAAMAMASMIEKGMMQERGTFHRFWRWIRGNPVPIWWSTPNPEHVAIKAYTHADSMLAERAKGAK